MNSLHNTITYANINSGDYGVYVDGSKIHDSAERDFTLTARPFINGDKIEDNGRWKNQVLTYDAYITPGRMDDYADFRAALLSKTGGYFPLNDSYDPDHFRLAILSGAIPVTPRVRQRTGTLKLTFNCRPERYLSSGESAITVASGDTIANPTQFPAAPIIKYSGYGYILFNSTSKSFTLDIKSGSPNNATIDCAEYTLSAPGYVGRADQLPLLLPGDVTITYASTITALTITPRWYTL